MLRNGLEPMPGEQTQLCTERLTHSAIEPEWEEGLSIATYE